MKKGKSKLINTSQEAFEITPVSRNGGLIEVGAMERKRCREICETHVGGWELGVDRQGGLRLSACKTKWKRLFISQVEILKEKQAGAEITRSS